VLRNIEAAKALSLMVQTSMGPNGMNKLVINHLEKIFVTSDSATIMRELEVAHPAAKILVMAGEAQEAEFGDNTNFVLSFSGELLKQAEELLVNGLHTAEIVLGYERAHKKMLELLPDMVVRTINDVRDTNELAMGLKPIIGTKQYGFESFLAGLVTEAALATMTKDRALKPRLNMDFVRIAKLRGGDVRNSTVVKGMILVRDAEGVVKRAKDAKVIVFGCGIEAGSMEAKGTVLLKSAEDLLNYNKSEEKKMEEQIAAIAACGATVVVANGSVSEMAMHFLDKFKLMVLKTPSKFELRRICGALGATAVVRLGAASPEEMGFCSLIEVKEIGSRKVTVFSQELDEDTSVTTIALRASTEHVMNDIERAIDDGINSIRTFCTDGRLLPGAGAVELELSRRLYQYADEVLGIDQYAIRKFAEALLVIPRTLVENSGVDITSMMNTLNASHSGNGENCGPNMGYDIEENCPIDSSKVEIFDGYACKVNAMRHAIDAAVTVLRVDQIVMSKPAGGPKPPSQGQPN
jgi:T-complex protein 1 subunit theta